MNEMKRFPSVEKPDFEKLQVNEDLVNGIIALLEKEKISYAEAYETLDVTYRYLQYRSQFLGL